MGKKLQFNPFIISILFSSSFYRFLQVFHCLLYNKFSFSWVPLLLLLLYLFLLPSTFPSPSHFLYLSLYFFLFLILFHYFHSVLVFGSQFSTFFTKERLLLHLHLSALTQQPISSDPWRPSSFIRLMMYH